MRRAPGVPPMAGNTCLAPQMVSQPVAHQAERPQVRSAARCMALPSAELDRGIVLKPWDPFERFDHFLRGKCEGCLVDGG
jgi:hypothetical protein